jgi:PAS domain S-box-containing protein
MSDEAQAALQDDAPRTTAPGTTTPSKTTVVSQPAQMPPALSARILDLLGDGVALCDGSETSLPLRYVNPAFERLSGWPAAELQGQGLAALFREGDRATAFDLILAGAAAGERGSVEQRLARRDGSRFWARAEALPLGDIEGERRSVLLVLSDITAAREQGSVLQEAQKLRSIGELTGGVAHDFNNLLTVIIGHAEAMLAHPQDARAVQESAEATLRTAERAARLTQRMLAFARRQSLVPEVVDLGARLAEMAAAIRRALPAPIEIAQQNAPDLWPVLIDPAQLESAVLSVVANAREAMAGSGRLILELANRRIEEGFATLAGLQAGEYVVLTVADTGRGMAPEIARRAFEPFFTTKETGQGNGLGLSMVYGFVKQSGGHVSLYSEPGLGTTLRLYLPRAPQRPSVAAEAAAEVQAPRGRGRILVVEDDALVRGYVVAAIRALGYHAREAQSGAEALAILESGESFDLLFTDVVMPGKLGGGELAARASRLDARLRVLFTSGYTQDQVVAQQRLSGQAQFLSKPYRRAELAQAIRQALARP